LLAFTVSARADVALHGLFTDHMVLQRDIPVAVYGLADPGEKISVSFAGQRKSATADKDGHWSVALDAMKAWPRPADMTVAGKNRLTLEDILVGDVWVCSGQSNMDFCPGSYGGPYDVKDFELPLVRHFHMPGLQSLQPQTSVEIRSPSGIVKQRRWVVCSPKTGNHITAVGLYFARKVNLETGIPIGLIKSSWNGTRIEPWISPEGWASVPELPAIGKMPTELKHDGSYPSTPHVLYHGKIHPLTKFAIKGVLWYQGESNGNEGDSYFFKMRALVNGWRKAWNQGDFPFYFVQLPAHQAPNNDPAGGDGLAKIRMAQLKSLSIVNTGMASAIDLGDFGNPKNIHIFDKKSVGERLALWALAKDYPSTTLRAGGKAADLVYSGPLYKGMKIEGDPSTGSGQGRIRIFFDSVGSGLIIANIAGGFQPLIRQPQGKLKRFAIAGADKKWFWANAVIDGKTVVVSSPDVPKPVAVRYAFGGNPEGANLYNEEGLPASPFCTDNWLMK